MNLPDSYIQQVLDTYDEKGKELGIARGNVKRLEEQLKITRGRLMKVMKAEGVEAVTAQEREAITHPTYEAAVKELVAAITKESDLEHEVHLCEMQYECWRTISATRRKIIESGG